MELQLTSELVDRLILAERDCYTDWVRAMEALDGNPFGIAVREFGNARAILCSRVGAEIWNRVFHLTPAEMDLIPSILDFYREYQAQPLFDLSPYSVPPYWEASHMTLRLAKEYGMFQAAFHQILYGVPTINVPAVPETIDIQEVDANNRADFIKTYEQVWESGEEIAVLIGQPNFRCYLAYVDGHPAGLGVLHVSKGAASMANPPTLTVPTAREQRCQTWLLYHRIKQAALLGCDLMVSQCMPGSTSQRNQLRVGFQIAGTKVWWIPTQWL